MIDPRFLDPAYYKVGAADIGQFQWLHERLTVHGHSLIKYDDGFKRRVQNFQLAQGWTGSNADGYVGPTTLKRLSLDPVSNISLKNWKLTLPTPLGGSTPEEIKQPALATYEDPPYFDRIPGGYGFRAPTNGAHTPNSSYPRSELREMNPDGTNAKWSTSTGRHEMVIEQAITALPLVKRHVVAGQIHDGVTKVIMIRLEGPKLFVESPHADDQILDINYVLGTRFRISVLTDSAGIHVFYNGVKKADVFGQFSDCYFKAGCYTQAYAGQEYHEQTVPKDTYGEVVIYSLNVLHAV